MTVEVVCLSGLGPKEPAAFLAIVEGRRILLDCGAGPDGTPAPLDRAGRVDAVVLSHAHPDHAGGLAALSSVGRPPVHATAEVLSAVPDSFERHVLPARGSAAVAGVAVETGRSGHAIGGVWIRLAGPAGLLYMGDHTAASDVLGDDPPPATETVILDASYGAAEETRAVQTDALLACARSGPLLLPVPADGRGVEMALFLAAADVPVALCPAVRAAVRSLAEAAAPYARDDGVRVAAARLSASAPAADPASDGAVLAAGATADSGAAAALVHGWLRRGGTVLFTGHLARGTTGARLVAEGLAEQRRWNVHPTLAENAGLVRRLGARRVVPAFGDPADWPALALRIAPARIAPT